MLTVSVSSPERTWSATSKATSSGIAKPSTSSAVVPSLAATVTPTTWPASSTTGPPE